MDKKRRPNVLIFFTDQHRYECLGCHGHPVVKTPNIDRLAEQGVDFQQTYSQSAICMPSRISMFTGQYLHTHGIQSNSSKVNLKSLTMLPAVLKKHGYLTAVIGKTHIGKSSEAGFEYARLCAALAGGETNHYKEYLQKNNMPAGPGDDSEYKSYDSYVSKVPYKHSPEHWTGEESIKFLESRDKEKPFFLWTSFERPHSPTCVPVDNPFPYDPEQIGLPPADLLFYTKPETKRPGCENMWNVFHTGEKVLRQAIANYFSLISMIDDQVGRIIKFLEKQGELENTIIVFTSDHGDFCGEFGQFGKNISTFDVLYSVPLIFFQKGVTDKEQIHEMTELVDVMPTLLEMLNIPCPRTVQGESLAPVVYGSSRRCGLPWQGREEVFFETPFVKTVRTKTHKLSFCFKGDREWGQLYDLFSDPGETRNLYGNPSYQWVQNDLERRLLRWFIRTQQPQVHGAGIDEVVPAWRWYKK